jgi:hypothetical protein
MAQCKIGAKVQRGARLVRQNRKRKQLANNTKASDELLPVAAETPEWALGPTGAAEEFGFPTNYGLREKQTWMRQEAFLKQYSERGKLIRAAEAAGMTIWAVEYWQKQDLYQFNRRLEVAHARYSESIEQMIDDRLQHPEGNRGSDPLLMFKQKAENPSKYREDVKVVDTGIGAMLLDKLRDLAAQNKPQLELESSAVEGEFTELNQG